MPHTETMLESKEIFNGRVIRVTLDTVRLENGNTGTREVVHHHGGACILPVDAEGNVLEDIQIGVQRGTTGENYCQGAHGVDHVTSLDNGSLAVQALLNGQVDCVVIDNAPAQEFVEANPGLKILDTEYANEDYAIGVAKGNTAMLDAVNGALAELEADGTLQSIVDQYISAE